MRTPENARSSDLGIGTSVGSGASHRAVNYSAIRSTSSSVIMLDCVLVVLQVVRLARSLLNLQYSMKLSTALKNVANFLSGLPEMSMTCVAALAHES